MLDPRFKGMDNFVFDLDGTLWRWTYLLPGARRTIADLYKLEKSVWFLTNNTALPRAGYAAKLRAFGVPAKPEQIINPGTTAARMLRGKRVLVLAEGVTKDLRRAGVTVTAANPKAVLIGEDRKLTYRKLVAAASAIAEGAAAYKTAAGGTWLVGRQRWPGTGAIAAAIEAATGVETELIGKPSPHMLRDIRRLGLRAGRTIFVGDETTSDMVAGNRLGWATALVLTGNSSREDALLARGEQKPDYVINSVADLMKG